MALPAFRDRGPVAVQPGPASSIIITGPSSVQVGDLLMAHFTNAGSSSVPGWSGSGGVRTRFATEDDAAPPAKSYTFPLTSTSYTSYGVILAYSGISATSTQQTAVSTTTYGTSHPSEAITGGDGNTPGRDPGSLLVYRVSCDSNVDPGTWGFPSGVTPRVTDGVKLVIGDEVMGAPGTVPARSFTTSNSVRAYVSTYPYRPVAEVSFSPVRGGLAAFCERRGPMVMVNLDSGARWKPTLLTGSGPQVVCDQVRLTRLADGSLLAYLHKTKWVWCSTDGGQTWGTNSAVSPLSASFHGDFVWDYDANRGLVAWYGDTAPGGVFHGYAVGAPVVPQVWTYEWGPYGDSNGVAVGGVRVYGTANKPLRARRLPDGSFAFGAETTISGSTAFRILRTPLIGKVVPPWQVWAVPDPGAAASIMEWNVDPYRGVLMVAFLRWPSSQWWYQEASLDGAGGTWEWSTPRLICSAAYGRPWLWAREDGVLEFWHTRAVDDPNALLKLGVVRSTDGGQSWQ